MDGCLDVVGGVREQNACHNTLIIVGRGGGRGGHVFHIWQETSGREYGARSLDKESKRECYRC